MAKLTGAKLEARLEAGIASRAPGRHGFGGGLWLEVAGGRSWSHRYTTQGKARSMGLGAWPAVSLSRAREKVAANRALLDGGIDPIDERRREKATDTLAKARGLSPSTPPPKPTSQATKRSGAIPRTRGSGAAR